METEEIIKTASGALNESVNYMGFKETLIFLLIFFLVVFVWDSLRKLQTIAQVLEKVSLKLEKISTRQEDICDNVKDIKEKINQIRTI